MPAKPFTLTTPLPPGELVFESISHTSELSALEQSDLSLLSAGANVDPNALLGKTMRLTIELRGGAKRHVHGYVTRFGAGTHKGRSFGYLATLRPWLWFLTRTGDCRIFQGQTVPQIVEAVFADHASVADFKFKLTRSYRTRVYCVQYRESDFQFVSRLLEDEGIYWYFEHSDGGHKLMLVDDASSHDPVPGRATFPSYDTAAMAPPDTDFISQWRFEHEVQTGKTALTSYDFERPSTSLLVQAAQVNRKHQLADLEQFDFQGDYVQRADGEQLNETRLDEAQCRFQRCSGGSNALALAAGHCFKLDRHARADQNQEYLLVQTSLQASDPGGESGPAAGELKCSFQAMPRSQQFRPPRATARPFVQGPQTAVVVGPGGEEIHTDKYGRVKVQFHWDRLGAKNEKSSCWVRVSSPWAGKSFGFVQIPRIGQEVVVDFLEGDPDQPIITGRVYNAEQMPPWALPANATQSGVLTRSSKGGSYGNANAIRFEDKKGSEQLWLHAEKNQDIEVENDETHWVGHDRKKTIDHDETTLVKHDRTETVNDNETITVGANRTESVGHNESITVGSGRSVSVGGSETKTVALQRTHAVGVNESIAIGAAQEVVIGAAQTVAVGAAQSITVGVNQSTSVGKDQSTTVGANRTIEVGKDLSTTVAKNEQRSIGEKRETTVGKDDLLKVGKKFVLEAGDEITLKTGDASITMKKDGTIQIKGKDITITGSGKIGIKASGDMVLKGSKIAQN